jgi:hypothetical protein
MFNLSKFLLQCVVCTLYMQYMYLGRAKHSWEMENVLTYIHIRIFQGRLDLMQSLKGNTVKKMLKPVPRYVNSQGKGLFESSQVWIDFLMLYIQYTFKRVKRKFLPVKWTSSDYNRCVTEKPAIHRSVLRIRANSQRINVWTSITWLIFNLRENNIPNVIHMLNKA